MTSRWRSSRCDWKMGPSSKSNSSQRSASRICATFSGVERSRSVSSMRRTNVPPSWRAASQLNSAVRGPPMCSAPVGEGAKRRRIAPDASFARRMLIGAHVSPAGGPAKAVERGVELGAGAIQIFNQSPRMWRPRHYSDEEVADYHAALKGSGVKALLIHAVYLLNCASTDRAIREKSQASLVASLEAGEKLGAVAVVLHSGSALKGKVPPAIKRAGKVIRSALEATEGCALHLENTAGSGGTLGRTFGELADLLDAAGGGPRLGICLDSCHLYASGYDVRTHESLDDVLDQFDREVGCNLLGSLHFNDSQSGFASNVDRHAISGAGELGDKGGEVWFSEPRFESLPCVLETPGVGTDKAANAVAHAKKLRRRGLRKRR